jgi:hypothetical protein
MHLRSADAHPTVWEQLHLPPRHSWVWHWLLLVQRVPPSRDPAATSISRTAEIMLPRLSPARRRARWRRVCPAPKVLESASKRFASIDSALSDRMRRWRPDARAAESPIVGCDAVDPRHTPTGTICKRRTTDSLLSQARPPILDALQPTASSTLPCKSVPSRATTHPLRSKPHHRRFRDPFDAPHEN